MWCPGRKHWSVMYFSSTLRKEQRARHWINYFEQMTIGGSVCLSLQWFKTLSFIASLFSAALRYSQTASQQRASTYHSLFHPSCPHSRCHGHRPNGQECSADYHSETRSPCTRAVLRDNTKTEISVELIKRRTFELNVRKTDTCSTCQTEGLCSVLG